MYTRYSTYLPNSPENQLARFFPPMLGVKESTLSVSLSLSLSLCEKLSALLLSGVCGLASNAFCELDLVTLGEARGKVMPRARTGDVPELGLSRPWKL